jgi:hypothetical protein
MTQALTIESGPHDYWWDGLLIGFVQHALDCPAAGNSRWGLSAASVSFTPCCRIFLDKARTEARESGREEGESFGYGLTKRRQR